MSFELYNSDTKAINITGWKFFEAGTNHRLTLVQGSMVIPAGGYAIIADNAATFLNEHPDCKCTVIDSTFSLHNTGEYIALKNATLDIVDEVAYNASWGADGNGKSLERNATGGWEESRIDGGTPCRRNSVLVTPPLVINASANPPVIAVNTGITELRVDVAGIDSPIDVVTVDLSPTGGNASTVMSNIGNYTKDNISWTTYNYTTNASVEGTFNLTVNATDINGNYNDAVSFMLEVKKTVIPSPGHM